MSELEFEDAKSLDYKYIYSTGAFGGISNTDARIIFYLDRIAPETCNEGEKKGKLVNQKIIRELQVEVHMSPQQFEDLWLLMTELIKKHKRQTVESTHEKLETWEPLSVPELEKLAVQ